MNVATNTGTDTAQTGVLRTLRVGNEMFRDLPVTLIQSPTAFRNRSEDGLLPACLFRTIYFNNKGNYVILNPHFSWTRVLIIVAFTSLPVRARRAPVKASVILFLLKLGMNLC